MNIKSLREIKKKFNSLLAEENEEEGVKHDAYMLMADYLSEVERVQEQQSITRKELANKINISPSYLTQVFRGDKPLNFVTLAKIKRALNIVFVTRALPNDSMNHLRTYSISAVWNNPYCFNKGISYSNLKAAQGSSVVEFKKDVKKVI
jgi:ribosome-binding protein aMBF1 (putative translation factor)